MARRTFICSKCNAPLLPGQSSWCSLCNKEYKKEWEKKNRHKYKTPENREKRNSRRRFLIANDPEYRARKNASKRAWLSKQDPERWKPLIKRNLDKYRSKKENRDKMAAYGSSEANLIRRRKRFQVKYKNPRWKIIHNQRTRVSTLLSRRKGGSKPYNGLELIGCSIDHLMAHISSQFKSGMTWDNHGKEWHLDHIHPLSKFDVLDMNQAKLAWNWQNLRPLWKKENLEKSAKITVPQMFLPLTIG